MARVHAESEDSFRSVRDQSENFCENVNVSDSQILRRRLLSRGIRMSVLSSGNLHLREVARKDWTIISKELVQTPLPRHPLST